MHLIVQCNMKCRGATFCAPCYTFLLARWFQNYGYTTIFPEPTSYCTAQKIMHNGGRLVRCNMQIRAVEGESTMVAVIKKNTWIVPAVGFAVLILVGVLTT